MKTKAISATVKVQAIEIGHLMNQEGLPKKFIAAAVSAAFEYEGVYDLFRMWAKEKDAAERNEIIADLQELIDDCSGIEHTRYVNVRFDDLETIAANIRSFKDSLRHLVDERGGLKSLTALTGIPQPSLSRFFNSATVPRRATLHRIAKALQLKHLRI